MAQDQKVVSLNRHGSFDRFSMPSALIRLRDTAGPELRRVLSQFFDNADDALFDMADRAGSEGDQKAYFDAMRELRLRRRNMTVSVLQYVSRAFNEMGRFDPALGGSGLEDVSPDSLSLVGHAELEQKVAIENLISKLRTRYLDSIKLLTARVEHLVPGVKLAERQMPLSPEVLCTGLGEACGDLDIDIRAKLVVLKLFDKLLFANLDEFYQGANRLLIGEGVLPDLKASKETAAGKAQQQPGQRAPGPAAQAPGQASGSGQATFSELSELLHQGKPGQDGAPAGAVQLDIGTLMIRLGEVQISTLSGGTDRVVPLAELLRPVLQPEGGKVYSVRQVDSDVINLVSMLFDFILEDRQLPAVMKALIARLQIPVLKVALSDQNFFNRGGHPARKLLNELAMAGIGWTEKPAGQRDPLREKVKQVVERLLHDFTDNVEMFAELLADFGHFMDLDRRRRELVEQRLRDAEEGRARQEYAAQAVTDLIVELTAGRDIPVPIQGMLNEPWRKYLQWLFLREGDTSVRWQHAVELTGRLVWSVDPQPVTDTTRTELLRAIPTIVDELRKALQDISWDPFATDGAIRDLELAHVDVFQKLVIARNRPPQPVPAAPAPVIAEPAAPVAGAESPVAEEDQEELAARAEWLARADSLRVGSWIELASDKGKLRCKLAAFIKATGKYIFVNRNGAKVAEYYREDLASALASGELSMLDDGLIFDRALESIIDNLRSSRRD